MSELKTWIDCRKHLQYQCERRRIDSLRKAHVQGSYLTVTFPDLFTDASLNFVASYTGGELVSVTHRCSPVYDCGTSATFRVPPCPRWPTLMPVSEEKG